MKDIFDFNVSWNVQTLITCFGNIIRKIIKINLLSLVFTNMFLLLYGILLKQIFCRIAKVFDARAVKFCMVCNLCMVFTINCVETLMQRRLVLKWKEIMPRAIIHRLRNLRMAPERYFQLWNCK